MGNKKVELTREDLIQHIYTFLDVPEENVSLNYGSFVEDFDASLHTIRLIIWGEMLDVVEYPATWKDAVKLRWFPHWLLKHFPCNFRRLEAKALYPKISFKEHCSKVIIREYPQY